MLFCGVIPFVTDQFTTSVHSVQQNGNQKERKKMKSKSRAMKKDVRIKSNGAGMGRISREGLEIVTSIYNYTTLQVTMMLVSGNKK